MLVCYGFSAKSFADSLGELEQIQKKPRNLPAARSEPRSRRSQLETESGAVFGRRLPAGLRPVEFSQLKIPNVALIQPGPDSAVCNVFFGPQFMSE